MSVKCTSRVWEHSATTASHRLVMLAIADFANEDGVGWPGQERLAKMVKLAVSSVKRIISDLVESKELWRGRRREGGPNAYIVLVGLDEDELERAIELVVDLGCDEKQVRADLDPGITPDTTLVSPLIPPGITAMDPDPSLSVLDPPSSGFKDKPRQLDGFPYSLAIYYKDQRVMRVGTARDGPWDIWCPACEGTVRIHEKDKPQECQCAMHEFTLTSKRPPPKSREKKHEAVEAYYSVYKGKVKYDALDETWEKQIAEIVTDIPRWKEVLVAYIGPSCKGSPFSVDKILIYYKESRMPGTKRPKEPKEPSPATHFRPVDEVNPPASQDDIDWYEREHGRKAPASKTTRILSASILDSH